MAKFNKLQKKSFFDVSSNLTAAKISLYASSMEELNGKIIRIDLTRSLRGKSLDLKLRVKLNDGKLESEPVSLELSGSFIRRMIRKGADYVEDSFVSEAKDGKALIKPFIIARNKISRAVRKKIRDLARENLLVFVKSRTIKEMFTEIMTNKIQKDLSLKLKKVYPLALCEIRVFRIITDNMSSQSKVVQSGETKKEVKEEPSAAEKADNEKKVSRRKKSEARKSN